MSDNLTLMLQKNPNSSM